MNLFQKQIFCLRQQVTIVTWDKTFSHFSKEAYETHTYPKQKVLGFIDNC